MNRQKIVLALLLQANKHISSLVFVKLMFLLHQEPELRDENSFYDFVPYKYGPFSFTLYRELDGLRQNGYIKHEENRIALCEENRKSVMEIVRSVPLPMLIVVGKTLKISGGKSPSTLVKEIYTRYPWYASKSELTALKPNSSDRKKRFHPAVYTAGYEGRSVDSFFNHLLMEGIKQIIDVRANPISRRYGFSKKQFCDIAKKLGFDYYHIPRLGIPSLYRTNLSDYDSYQRLLKKYEEEMLPKLQEEIVGVCNIMIKKTSVLVCVEKDVQCCHRSRLAETISKMSGLEVKHL